jgi:hypothetical protein
MRQKHFKLITLFLLVVGPTGLNAQRVYIGEKEGSQTAYFLSDVKKMVFSTGNIAVHKTDGALEIFTLTDVRNLNFNLITSVEKKHLPLKPTGTFQVFPNPVNDVLNIQLPASLPSAGRIEIISMEGKLVYTENISSHSAVFRINLSGLPKGIYLCRVNSGKTIKTAKFIMQ